MGPLEVPVTEEQAAALRAVARPARYGQGTQTLVDPQVRDTWEVPTSRVRIDKRRWNQTLRPTLDQLRSDLGLPDGCRLDAQLHSMLVYEPGQFFLPHQDSEKADGMVATLVVTLPTAARGGTLIVEHGGQRATYRSPRTRLSMVAFYADCRHQVQPVRGGHRIALTYNLVLTGEAASTAASDLPETLQHEVERCVTDHFGTSEESSTRLVCLLDHEYTQRALSWTRLKGRDAATVAALRSASTRTGCVAALALGDVHETWDAHEPGVDGWRPWDFDEDEDEWEGDEPYDGALDSEDYDLGELIDSDMSLSHWLIDEPRASVQQIDAEVADHEVCAVTPSCDLAPYAAEYEGFTGNYGNTMDRWYHRAAVVLWPRKHDFEVRSRARPQWALTHLAGRIRVGKADEARGLAATLSPFWDQVASGRMRWDGSSPSAARQRALFTRALRVADGIDDQALASMLVGPFAVEQMTPKDAQGLAALSARYGEDWLRGALEVWFGLGQTRWMPRSAKDRLTWVASLPVVCAALTDIDDAGARVAGILARLAWSDLAERMRSALHTASPSTRDEALADLASPIAAVLAGAAGSGADDVVKAAVATLRQAGDELLHGLVQVCQEAAGLTLPPTAQEGLQELKHHCFERLGARLARPSRDPDDWSIRPPTGCDCDLCQKLSTFLADARTRDLEWPIAKRKRQHVHQRIERHELPVTHRTRRKGSPYTLVLHKTAALFALDEKRRRRDEEDLARVVT